MPPYGCCDLGHVNLARLVLEPFTPNATIDLDRLENEVAVLVRMLDNVLDLTPWPLPEQQREAQAKRRLGVGITGLGDALIMLGLKYSSAEGREVAREIMELIRNTAYRASVELAKERGAFPLFNAEKYLEEGTFASRLPEDIKDDINRYGIRNSHLLSLAPTGTGSLTFGNNCSSGCEPVFDFVQKRKIKQPDGTDKIEEGLMDYAYLVYREQGGDPANLPDYFECVASLDVDAHLGMLKVLAPYVDAAISKTVNVPADYPFEDFKGIYMDAWNGGLKGITTYRPNNEIGSVLISSSEAKKEEDLDASDPDRRFRLAALPETVMSSLRWLDRPHMPDGNPSYTYMVECPQGDFAVMIGHHVNGGVHPFEVWVNGAETPRGLGAIAKTLSADMRTFDRNWLNIKLDALLKCDGEAFDMPMPPTGEVMRVPGAVSAFARIVKHHTTKIGWLESEGDDSLVNAMMFRKEPKAGTNGTLSWTVDIKNPATGDDFAMFVKELEMPDGARRPYSVWAAGEYPKNLDGLCKLLSIDMRIADLAWIGMKLRKLLSYKEPQGDFLARIPGSEKQANFSSTVAYMARLLIHRYHQLGLLNEDGTVETGNVFLGSDGLKVPVETAEPKGIIAGTKCPECGVHAVVKYNGCDKCTNCGYTGSCG